MTDKERTKLIRYLKYNRSMGADYLITDKDVDEIIKALEQEPKTGHWIADVDRWGNVVTTVNGYKCDKCNTFNADKDNYCPNCGAKMVEPQESEDNDANSD